MGVAGGRAGALILEGPGASEEAPRGVPVKREGRNVKCNLYCAVLQGKHALHVCSQNVTIVQEAWLIFITQKLPAKHYCFGQVS